MKKILIITMLILSFASANLVWQNDLDKAMAIVKQNKKIFLYSLKALIADGVNYSKRLL